MEWLADLPKDEYKNDVLCVAGDVSDHIEIVEQVWKLLVPRFHRVFFVPYVPRLSIRQINPD